MDREEEPGGLQSIGSQRGGHERSIDRLNSQAWGRSFYLGHALTWEKLSQK